jgi:integrase/recombinase XerD
MACGTYFDFMIRNRVKVILPSIERTKEISGCTEQPGSKSLLKAPALLRHRLIIGLLYGCGLRNHELCKLKITDLNLERQMLHVREGKGRKDRYVPLCDMLVRGVKKYLASEHPVEHLFNGKSRTGDYVAMSARGVQWAIREARRLSGIKKQVTAHCLRHTYATHLLEMGIDIVTLKELLGHAHIETTMEYLHVARIGRSSAFSPLVKLYEKSN